MVDKRRVPSCCPRQDLRFETGDWRAEASPRIYTKDFGIHGKERRANSFAVIASLISLYQAPALAKLTEEWCM